MEITVVVVGQNQTNCYLLSQEGKCIIIDPGDHPDLILEIIEKNNLEISGIINTHGHFDHILGNNEIMNKVNTELMINEFDIDYLLDPFKNLSAYILNRPFYSKSPTRILYDGDIVKFGNDEILCIHTPGHTPGSSCFYIEKQKIIFTGDTLFKFSFGRVDLVGGDAEKMKKSLKKLYSTIPGDTLCLPGHGESFMMKDLTNWLENILREEF